MPVPENVDTLQRQLIRDEVYDTLRRWIVEGVLHPEERVSDKQLAERLGVSRMPIREALRTLADDGLVEVSANRWTRVSPIDPSDAERIYPVVTALETLAVGLAAGRLGPPEIEAMEQANVRLRDAIATGNPDAAASADADFHGVYIEASRNSELTKIIAELKVKLRRLDFAYFGGSATAVRSVDEHERILRALRAGDFAAAADAVRDNWEGSLKRVLDRVVIRR